MDEYTVSGAVANGVTFLDDTIPDWRDRVNMEKFDISSPFACVLGQVFRMVGTAPTAWTAGTWALHDWVESTDRYNPVMEFSLLHEYGFEQETGYDELEAEWRKVLTAA